MLYAILFFGILIGGEWVFVPALYTAFQTGLSVHAIIGISLAATFIADTAWYLIGRMVPYERVVTLPLIRKKRASIDSLGGLFDAHAMQIIFISKFVYGTRIAVQLSSGITRILYLRFICASVGGTVALAAVLTGFVWFIQNSLSALTEHVYYIHASLLVFIILVVALQFIMRRLARRIWNI